MQNVDNKQKCATKTRNFEYRKLRKVIEEGENEHLERPLRGKILTK